MNRLKHGVRDQRQHLDPGTKIRNKTAESQPLINVKHPVIHVQTMRDTVWLGLGDLYSVLLLLNLKAMGRNAHASTQETSLGTYSRYALFGSANCPQTIMFDDAWCLHPDIHPMQSSLELAF